MCCRYCWVLGEHCRPIHFWMNDPFLLLWLGDSACCRVPQRSFSPRALGLVWHASAFRWFGRSGRCTRQPVAAPADDAPLAGEEDVPLAVDDDAPLAVDEDVPLAVLARRISMQASPAADAASARGLGAGDSPPERLGSNKHRRPKNSSRAGGSKGGK
jgi:hypothetical protein